MPLTVRRPISSPAMGTSSEKHARQQANRKAGDEIRREHEAAARRKSLAIGGVAVLICAVIIGVIVALTGSDKDTENTAKSDDSTTTTTVGNSDSTAPESAAAELPTPPAGITLTEATTCPPEQGSEERVQAFAGPPPTCIEEGVNYTATFNTTEGNFTAELDAKTAPIAVNNFVVLSRYRFYDGVPFHRIITGFVIQGGDGDGPPWGNNDLGYSFKDELPDSSSAYTDYSLAMANSGSDTNGSQFFVVLPGGGSQLQPLYTRFGEVTEGRDVIDAIGQMSDGGESPTKAVVINSVTITSSKG